MKKIIMTIGLFCAVCVSALAQNTITMKFTGRNQNNDWIPLSYVLVENQTQRWQELVYYPDTTLFMGNVGIDDYLQNEKVQLFQNVPNPFDGVTDFALQLDEDQRVLLEIYDVNGKMVAQYEHALPQGQHLFRATLTAPQTYLLSAKTENDRLHIKMVNKGNGGENSIAYLGEGGSIQYQLKSDSKDNAPYYFANGDWMKYVGYANLCGTEYVSTPVEQNQTQSETVNLVFTLPVPTVITNAADNITASSARLNGDANGQGYTLTERGFYYGSSNSSMTEKVVSNGTGDGAYASFITDLNPGSTYYFKAYAKSPMGTVYGQTLSVQTLATYPTVNTGTISDIMPTSAIGQGNVVSNNGATVTERGLCWSSTTQFPTLTNANHVSAGTGGNGNYSCSMTGLVPITTYYVRAYATNSEGTAYGNTVSFTTLAPTVATITTTSVTNITQNSAASGGNVTADGGATVTARGVYWSTSQNPTVSNSHTTNGSGTGSFTSSMTGLTAGTTYYVRAYATNSAGTAYGNQVSFTTPATLPTVSTTTVTSITSTSATSGGNVTATGGASVTARGVCWSTSQNPTVSNSHTTNGSGTGSFTSSMTGLTAGTTYYVRAYATNSAGTAYGNQVSFTTNASVPTVTTTSVTNITQNTATSGGNVTATGGASVTARGVCWSTSQNPTVSNSHTTNGSGTGSFTSSMTGLTAGTTYYVRAYATNSAGTAYGEQKSFTTAIPFTCGTSTVTDYDGNTYNTVQIGQQCWMKQNLRTTHYSDGTTISLGSTMSTSTAYRYYPNNNSSNVSTYGYLYNWKAVMRNSSSSSSNPSGVQGICPTGWHVPSDADWTQLENYVGSQSAYQCGGNSTNIAKALASTTGWNNSTNTCAVGNTPSTNNATGFSAVPAGYYYGSYSSFGYDADFWSATQHGSYGAYRRYLIYYDATVGRYSNSEYFGFSVRCLRD